MAPSSSSDGTSESSPSADLSFASAFSGDSADRSASEGVLEDLGDPSADADGPGSEFRQVQDLLVGEHARETDARLSRLEEQVDVQLSALRSDLEEQLEELENATQRTLEALRERIVDQENIHRTDVGDLQDQIQDLKQELVGTRTDVVEALKKLQDRVRTRLREQEDELMQKMAEQENELTQQMNEQHEELASTLDEEVDQLRETTADSRTLAALLEQAAAHLRE